MEHEIMARVINTNTNVALHAFHNGLVRNATNH